MSIPLLVVGLDPRDPNGDIGFGERLGHCYEYASRYLIAEAKAGREGRLVHGTIHGVHFIGREAPVLDHAWVECSDGGVFEPTSGRWWPSKALFLDLHDATVRVRYSPVEAAALMLSNGHCGPWDFCEPCMDDSCDECMGEFADCGCRHLDAA